MEVLKKAAAAEPEVDLLAEEAEEKIQAMAGVVRYGLAVVDAVKRTETLMCVTMKPMMTGPQSPPAMKKNRMSSQDDYY